MKIALCLSGQVRSWSLVKEKWFENFIDINPQMDVFCHFWHQFNGSEYVKNMGNGYIENYDFLGKYGDYSIDDILKFFKPKGFKIEDPLGSEFTNTISMFHSIKKCNNIRIEYEMDHNIKYDVVVRSRIDLLFKEPTKIGDISKNTLYVKNRPGGCGGLNDWFAYGETNIINLYSDIIDSLERYGLSGNCPEGTIGNFTSQNQINVSLINNTFCLIRNDGSQV